MGTRTRTRSLLHVGAWGRALAASVLVVGMFGPKCLLGLTRSASVRYSGRMTTITYYRRHSDRALRRPCPTCGLPGDGERHPRLYECHDVGAPTGTPCESCGADGRLVVGVMRPNGTYGPMTCAAGADGTQTPGPVADQGAVDPATALDLLRSVLGGASITADDLERIASTATERAVDAAERVVSNALARWARPTIVQVKTPDGTVRDLRLTHPVVPRVLGAVAAGEDVALYGPAGTGKSTIARQVAEALGAAYHDVACCAQSSKADLLGFVDAGGRYVPSSLYAAAQDAQDGGRALFLLDEADAATPSVLVVLNAAVAQRSLRFPNGERLDLTHVTFMVAMNTAGRGPDRSYTGRTALDAATLNRFSLVYVDHDRALEDRLTAATGCEQAPQVVAVVRRLRERAEGERMPVVLSVRTTVGLCRLLAAGWTWADAVDARIRCGMADPDWDRLTAGIDVLGAVR